MAFSSVRNRSQLRLRAFTLIELLVVTAIMVVVTSIVLVSNGKFGDVVKLENLTYDVALSIRQAQVYGISVARFGADIFTAGYGVHFDISNPTSYATFADAITVNGLYDCPNPGNPTPETCELVQTTTMTGGHRIIALCTTPLNGPENCKGVTKIDIVFIRPEPDALISASDISCILQNGSCQAEMRVVLASPRGDTMSVVAEASGQITVRRGTQ